MARLQVVRLTGNDFGIVLDQIAVDEAEQIGSVQCPFGGSGVFVYAGTLDVVQPVARFHEPPLITVNNPAPATASASVTRAMRDFARWNEGSEGSAVPA
jgi:hypothetical protein